MTELLSSLSLTQVVLIVFTVALAVKELVSLIDFFVKRARAHYGKENKQEDEKKEILAEIGKVHDIAMKSEKGYKKIAAQIDEIQQEYQQMFAQQQKVLDTLIASDIDDIKSDIVKQYNVFINQGWIDPFSLDAIEKRFQHYQEEGGNSYVENLVEKLRQLPNVPPKK